MLSTSETNICVVFCSPLIAWKCVFPPPSMDLSLVKNCSLTVALRHSVKFVVVRHTKVWKRRGEQQDYLGFYTLDSHHLSPSVHGLLGRKVACHNVLSDFICQLKMFRIRHEAVSFQVSSTTGLILRSQTCGKAESRRTKVPQCTWRDKRWTWPGAQTFRK